MYGSRSDESLSTLALATLIFVVVGGSAMRGCAEASEIPEQEVKTYLEDNGFSHPVITDIDKSPLMWGCGRDDYIRYEVTATSEATGRTVDLDVCKGLSEGMTIQL